jgi:hypothetical protein
MTTRRSGGSNKDIKEDANGPARSNGLARFAGTWSEEEHRQFEENIASLEELDDELWTEDDAL